MEDDLPLIELSDEEDSSFTNVTTTTLTSRSELSQSHSFKNVESSRTKKPNEEPWVILKRRIEHLFEDVNDNQINQRPEDLVNSNLPRWIIFCEKQLQIYREVEEKASQRIKDLEDLYSKQESKIQELTKENEKMSMIKSANDELNDYITESVDCHQREVGTLKAKLSLVRLEKEVEDSLSDSTSSPTKQKKRRKSSLLFWKKQKETEIGPVTVMTDEQMQMKLDEKLVEIERLRSANKTLTTQEERLENVIKQKYITIKEREDCIEALQNQTNALIEAESKNVESLCETESAMSKLGSSVNEIADEIRSRRREAKDMQKKLLKLEHFVVSADSTNKELLGNIHRKNYEMCSSKALHEENTRHMRDFVVHTLLAINGVKNVAQTEKMKLSSLIDFTKQAIDDFVRGKVSSALVNSPKGSDLHVARSQARVRSTASIFEDRNLEDEVDSCFKKQKKTSDSKAALSGSRHCSPKKQDRKPTTSSPIVVTRKRNPNWMAELERMRLNFESNRLGDEESYRGSYLSTKDLCSIFDDERQNREQSDNEKNFYHHFNEGFKKIAKHKDRIKQFEAEERTEQSTTL